jgi:glycosyltransferase involved in cell wall biosynthesis
MKKKLTNIMQNKIQIVYLYTEVMSYLVPVFKKLIENYNAEITLIHWDKKKLTPYYFKEIKGLVSYDISSLKNDELDKLVSNIDPQLIVISGWQEKRYLPIASRMKKKGKCIISIFDDKWLGNLRQLFGSAFLSKFIKSKYFTHALVAGAYQFEYAKKFGFSNNEIKFHALSCDVDLFARGGKDIKKNKFLNYPKRFLYAGRFEYIKGIDILVNAYDRYLNYYNGDWKLMCVGDGSLINIFKSHSEIEVKSFCDQETLLNYADKSGAFIVPSRNDQWGVVVQEFSLAGLPLIVSESVGAIPSFFIDKYNGLIFKNESVDDLAKKMYQISKKKISELIQMGEKSHQIGKTINPEYTAASIMSCLYNYEQ